MTAHSAAAAPEARVAVFSRNEQVGELLLVPNGARARKAVRGARTAGGERTWLRLCAPVGPMPRDARLHVLCYGHSVEFALQQPGACGCLSVAVPLARCPHTTPGSPGASPTGVVLRRHGGGVLECDVGRCAARRRWTAALRAAH